MTTEWKTSFATTAEMLAAEVLWALKVTTSHYSHHSCEEIGDTFRTMFPDSRIAAKFSYGSNKCSYLVTFGLAPYFKGLLLKRVKESGNIVVMFDESLNTVTKRKQMDVHIRSWFDGQVMSRYLTSQFMGHATADDVVAHFRSALEGLHLNHILQISMDGPNVNWKFFEIF